MGSQDHERKQRSTPASDSTASTLRKEHGFYGNEEEIKEKERASNGNAVDALFSAGLSTFPGLPNAPDRHTDQSTPLFISRSNSLVSLDDGKHQWVDYVPLDRVEVQVPPVERRWEYRTYDYDIRVVRVLKELDRDRTVSYLVEKMDDRADEVGVSVGLNCLSSTHCTYHSLSTSFKSLQPHSLPHQSLAPNLSLY